MAAPPDSLAGLAAACVGLGLRGGLEPLPLGWEASEAAPEALPLTARVFAGDLGSACRSGGQARRWFACGKLSMSRGLLHLVWSVYLKTFCLPESWSDEQWLSDILSKAMSIDIFAKVQHFYEEFMHVIEWLARGSGKNPVGCICIPIESIKYSGTFMTSNLNDGTTC